jgi:hypothetical protein
MAIDTITQYPAAPAQPSVDEPKLGEQHPLAPVIGAFKDDPTLDAVMEEVYRHRHEMEAEESQGDQNDHDGLAA